MIEPQAEPATDRGITIRGVSYRYRRADQDALHEIDLHIPRGSIFGLLGPNGAGKSTLLGLLSGSLRLQSGEILIAAADLSREMRRIQEMSAIVPQEYAFYETLSGRENLAYFAGVSGLSATQAKARIEQCAESCRLNVGRQFGLLPRC